MQHGSNRCRTRTWPRWGALLAVVLAFGATGAVSARTSTGEIVDRIDVEMYRHFLDDLLFTHPGDDRGYGPEHDLAQQNIMDEFQALGLAVHRHPFSYQGDVYYNVVARKTGAVTPERQYIIGSHYDSVDNPGADDNGSGTAGVMEIARVLSSYTFESTIIFITFDREEQGLIGSDAYANLYANEDIRGMVSMDMIAYNTGADRVDLYGRSASNPLKQSLAQAVFTYGDGLAYASHGSMDASDHAPFEWQGFQACLIIEDWGNPFYHTAQDHVMMPNYIDYDFATKVCRSVAGWLVDTAVLVIVECPADVDADGAVGFSDLLAVLSMWGPCSDCPEDVDGDGTVGFSDVLEVLSNWGACE